MGRGPVLARPREQQRGILASRSPAGGPRSHRGCLLCARARGRALDAPGAGSFCRCCASRRLDAGGAPRHPPSAGCAPCPTLYETSGSPHGPCWKLGLGFTFEERPGLTAGTLWKGCDLGGRGAGGGRLPRCASFLAFLGRAARRRGRGGGSRAAGMQTPAGGRRKAAVSAAAPQTWLQGARDPQPFPPRPQQQGTWGSLGMAVAPSPAWSPSVSLCLTDTGAGRAARGTGMRGWEQGSPVPSPAESSAPCSQPRCHQLGCLGDRRDASVRLGRELGFRRKGCAAWLGGCSLLLEPKSWF